MKPFLFITLLCLSTHYYAKPPNIIVMIGDGMGPAYMTAYRLYNDNLQTVNVEPSVFDPLLVGTARTDLDDFEHFVITDSAAAATAIATGSKTYFRAVSVNKQNEPLETTMEFAREMGYQTALVALTSIVHATPASFVTHHPSRKRYNELADQVLDDRIAGKPKVDIIFGGGQKHFIREDRNLLQEFNQLGYQTATDWEAFHNLSTSPAIALLGHDEIAYELDNPVKNRLTKLTTKALSLLDERPFYLMIEGSLIDWCGHRNDIACAMAEMKDFENSLKVVLDFLKSHPDTVFVLTSDHSTGGLTLAANRELIYKGPTNKYHWTPIAIRNIKASAAQIVESLFRAQSAWYPRWLELTAIELSAIEQKQLANLVLGNVIPEGLGIEKYKGMNLDNRAKVRAALVAISEIISNRTGTGWTTGGHTGIDVNVYSTGKYADLFRGNIDNTDIGKTIRRVLEKAKGSK